MHIQTAMTFFLCCLFYAIVLYSTFKLINYIGKIRAFNRSYRAYFKNKEDKKKGVLIKNNIWIGIIAFIILVIFFLTIWLTENMRVLF